jgi:hypothetical protein
MFAEFKGSPMIHSTERPPPVPTPWVLLGLAALLGALATGCIAEVQPDDRDPAALGAEESVHVDSEPINLSTTNPSSGGVNPGGPTLPPGNPLAPPEPEPSPWDPTASPPVNPGAPQPEPSPWRPHTPGTQASGALAAAPNNN